ncbi:MAG: hypothetical protein U9N61_03990 [Euryarchaeota archaeon]|nr:hypothetical protein [Euryarchaeota archaeon]
MPPEKETLEEKNKRRLDLYTELGVDIGRIVERETSIDMDRAMDCVDCILSHSTEILAIYYNLSQEAAVECFKMMKYQVSQHVMATQKRTKSDIVIPGENGGL